MDSEEVPPPPYSAEDPNPTPPAGPQPPALHLRGGNAPASDVQSRDGSSTAPDESAATPTHFVSATEYFVERAPAVRTDERSILDHYMMIYPRSQSKDFPRRPRCWNSRAEEIAQQDWDTFLRYLFPSHLGPAAASAHLPRQLRAQIQRDRKDRPQESDEQRELRVAAVIAEWNQYFFQPRAARIAFVYVTDIEGAPQSSLCPKCYPAATKATQETRPQQTLEDRQSASSTVPVGTPGQAVSPHTSQGPYFPGQYPYHNPPTPPAPYAPYGPAFFNPHTPPAYPPQLPPTQQPYSWGWNHQAYDSKPPVSKSGPFGWVSQLAAQAQRYGERISEQAEKYGDHISAQASHYGRQVEEQAMAHGRWIENQAGLGGKKAEGVYPGYPGGPQADWSGNNGHYQPYYPNYYHQPYPNYNMDNTTPPATNTTTTPNSNTNNTNTNTNNNTRSLATSTPNQRRRSSSVDSKSSDSSLTSIDSLSTTSDLSSSDYATIRAQLASLNDQHDRALYEAAVGLRQQLHVIQDSRRQARVAGRNHPWGQGLGGHNPHGGSWGRWESPQQQQRTRAEKRTRKEEMKSTKKAFKDVVRRAREEQREKRRSRRSRRRQERRTQQTQREEPVPELPLEQRLQNLELGTITANDPSTVRSSASFPSTVRSVSSSVASDTSSISTTSPASSHVNVRNTDEMTPGKDMKKQANGRLKKAGKKSTDGESHKDKKHQRGDSGK